MSIFTDWHFCSTIQLSPQETAEYLHGLQVLRNKRSRRSDLNAVLDQFEKGNPIQRAYVLPLLVDHLMSQGNSDSDGMTEEDTDGICLRMIKLMQDCVQHANLLAQHSDEHLEAVDSLLSQLQWLNVGVLKKALHKLSALELQDCENPHSYFETDKYALEIILLAAVRALTGNGSDGQQSLVESCQGLLEKAVEGRLGMLPERLALDILQYGDDGFDSLSQAFPEDWLTYPEYMELAIRMDVDPKEDMADRMKQLFLESYSFSWFQQHAYYFSRRNAVMWFAANRQGFTDKIKDYEEKPQMLCAILWQAMLWEYAADLDQKGAAETICRLWQLPPDTKLVKKNSIVYELNRRYAAQEITETARYYGVICANRTVTHHKKGKIVFSFPSAISSPWILCESSCDADDGLSRYNKLKKHFGAFRAFAAILVLQRVFRDSPERSEVWASNPVNLIRLMLNLGSALSLPAVQQEWDSYRDRYAWSYALRGLGLYATNTLNDLAIGTECPELPDMLWKQYSNMGNKKNQHLSVFSSPEEMVVFARWAYHAQAPGTAQTIGQVQSPWKPYEKEICGKLLPLTEAAPKLSVTENHCVLWLMLHTGYWKKLNDYGRLSLGENGPYESEEAAGRKVSLYQILCALDRPELSSLQRRDMASRSAWISLLTGRILSAISEGGIEEALIEEWRKALLRETELGARPEILELLLMILQTPAKQQDVNRTGYDLILYTVVTTIDQAVQKENADFIDRMIRCLPNVCGLFGERTTIQSYSLLGISLENRSKTEREWSEYLILLYQQMAEIEKEFSGAISSFHRDLAMRWRSQSVTKFLDSYGSHMVFEHQYKRVKLQRDWNSLTDHFVQYEAGTLYAARKRYRLTGYRIDNQFLSNSKPMGSANLRFGILCRGRWSQNGMNCAEMNFGGSNLETVPIESRKNGSFAEGEVLLYDSAQKKLKRPQMQEADEGEVFEVQLESIDAVNGVALKNSFLLPGLDLQTRGFLSREEIEAGVSVWAPNTLGFENGRYPIHGNLTCFVTYSNACRGYLPIERDFFRFLLDTAAPSVDFAELYYISSCSLDGEQSYLFSRSPGFNYRFRAKDWTRDSLNRLNGLIRGETTPLGLKIMVKQEMESGNSRLAIVSHETDNPRFAESLDMGEIYITHRGGENLSGNSVITCLFNNKSIDIAVDADKPLSKAENVELEENGWSLTRQRNRTAKVLVCKSNYLELNGGQEKKKQLIRELLDLKAGDVVMLEKVMKPGDVHSHCTAFITAAHLRVHCSVQSLSFDLGCMSAAGYLRPRECLIENISYRRETERNATPFTISGVPAGKTLYGVVSSITANDKVESSLVKTALLLGERLLFVDIPYSGFAFAPRTPGDRVDVIPYEDRWIAKAQSRTIYVRALWRAKTHGEGEPAGLFLGAAAVGPSYTHYCLTQDLAEPIIHLWPRKRLPEDPQSICGVPGAAHRRDGKAPLVEQKKPLFSGVNTGRSSRRRSYVCLRYRNVNYWGEAESGDFEPASSKWEVKPELIPAGSELYDVRRRFKPIREVRAPQEEPDQEGENESWYMTWLAEGRYHLRGEIKNGAFHIQGHKFPKQPGQDRAQGWISDIPFVAGEEPLWYKRSRAPYPERGTARVKILIQDNCWLASCRQADPIPFDEKLAEEFDAAVNETIQNYTLYFAGIDENQLLRFEWGYGMTTLVSSQDIIDLDGNIIGPTIFFGDKINEFKIVTTSPNEGPKLCVELTHLQASLEHRLWTDATENNIIQLLRIQVDVPKRRAIVSHASLSVESVGSNGNLAQSWDWRPNFNWKLDRDSVERLLAENAESTERYIFASLINQDKQYQHQHNFLFRYISLQTGASLQNELQQKRVCLTAGNIWSSYKHGINVLSNDYCLSFYLPKEGPLCENEDDREQKEKSASFSVNVMRRSFSVDESKMRVNYETNPRAYFGHNMLVYLIEERRCDGCYEWSGSVLNVPPRSTESLKRWIESQATCMISLGRRAFTPLDREEESEAADKLDLITIEVAPSILCRIPRKSIIGKYHEGDIAQLELQDGEILARVLIPSDRSYITPEGRAVELLIMDDAAKNYNPALVPRTTKYEFTVASFPQIRLSNRDLLEKLIFRPWPRIAFLKSVEGRLELSEMPSDEAMRAATIQIDRKTSQPLLQMIGESEEPQQTSWAQLSFMDRGSQKIATAARNSAWHYHDKCYAMVKDGSWEVNPLPNGRQYEKIVVFPKANGSLRLLPHELRQYGYTSREILEYGLPHTRNGLIPVAGSKDGSIWVELFPGRVVELPKPLLFIGRQRNDLTLLDRDNLAEGDELGLDCWTFSFLGGQRQLKVTEIRQGLRSFFLSVDPTQQNRTADKSNSERTIFLTVMEKTEGGLKIGSGSWSMEYPVADAEAWQIGESVGLTRENKLVRKAKVWRFDTAFIKRSGYALEAEGLDLNIRLNNDPAYWKGAEWIKEGLMDYRQCDHLLSAFGGSIPVTIDYVKTGEYIIVGHSQKADQDFAEGTILCCEVLGFIQDRNIPYVVLRAGRQLLRQPCYELFGGFPQPHPEALVNYLRETKQNVWLHKTENGWQNGVCAKERTGKLNAKLLGYVQNGDGILCLDEDNMSLAWLPLSLASFVSVEGDEKLKEKIFRVLRSNESGQIYKAVYRSSGDISLIDVDPFMKTLHVNTECRAVPITTFRFDTMQTYLARLYPRGSLIELSSENAISCGKDAEPLAVTVTEREGSVMKAVVNDSRHLRIKLTPEACEYLGALQRQTGRVERMGKDNPLFRNAERYAAIYQKAVASAKEGVFTPPEEGEFSELEMLLYLCDLRMKREFHPNAAFYLQCYKYVRKWLEADLTQYYLGVKSFSFKQIQTMDATDLYSMLSAVLLVNFLGTSKSSELSTNMKKLSVHALRMLGIVCENSIYQELILLNMKDGSAKGMWARFRSLSLDGRQSNEIVKPEFNGTLSEPQYRKVESVCGYILQQWPLLNEPKLMLTAMSLIACLAKNNPIDYDLYEKLLEQETNKPFCWRIGKIARMLTPGCANAIGFAELPQAAYFGIEQVWRSICSDSFRSTALYLDVGLTELFTDTQRGELRNVVDRSMDLLAKELSFRSDLNRF